MNKELEAFKRFRDNIRWLEENTSLKHYFENNKLHFKEDLDIIESTINDNYFYKYLLSRICEHMGLDITKHRDLIETENEIFNYICENECFRADVVTNKNKLKALEIIREKRVDVGWLLEVDFDLERYNRHIAPFHRYDLNMMEIKILKEVLNK